MRAFGSPSSIFCFSSAYTLIAILGVGPKSREVSHIRVAECPATSDNREEKLSRPLWSEGIPEVSPSGIFVCEIATQS